ncbi:DUF4406 domain-containing protein [Shewanella acanthi]|uniref:DUF4406 domain-containing protein n=1 Tax=Shewanella acanthi TaxID=2864212 RepID=UPI001C656711|nr:DUF4406 domain-containing protein [Shewanella acanthi]QYJ79416.1 DUF4406 domain-containing protein [Shewanella acanthi]
MARNILRKKVYIAGPMSGLIDFNRREFHLAAEVQRELGHTVLNPAILPDGLTEQEYMSICLPMLMCCDRIYLLDNWASSKGAKAEFALANKLGLDVLFQDGNDHEVTLIGLRGDDCSQDHPAA